MQKHGVRFHSYTQLVKETKEAYIKHAYCLPPLPASSQARQLDPISRIDRLGAPRDEEKSDRELARYFWKEGSPKRRSSDQNVGTAEASEVRL